MTSGLCLRECVRFIHDNLAALDTDDKLHQVLTGIMYTCTLPLDVRYAEQMCIASRVGLHAAYTAHGDRSACINHGTDDDMAPSAHRHRVVEDEDEDDDDMVPFVTETDDDDDRGAALPVDKSAAGEDDTMQDAASSTASEVQYRTIKYGDGDEEEYGYFSYTPTKRITQKVTWLYTAEQVQAFTNVFTPNGIYTSNHTQWLDVAAYSTTPLRAPTTIGHLDCDTGNVFLNVAAQDAVGKISQRRHLIKRLLMRGKANSHQRTELMYILKRGKLLVHKKMATYTGICSMCKEWRTLSHCYSVGMTRLECGSECAKFLECAFRLIHDKGSASDEIDNAHTLIAGA
jgi:hypothetical protein